jgi:hypothetical protein
MLPDVPGLFTARLPLCVSVQTQNRFRDVGALFEWLSGSLKGTKVHLGGDTLSCTPSTTSCRHWQSLAMRPQHLKQAPHEGTSARLFELMGCSQPPTVFAASGGACEISCGTLQLHSNTCIVLDKSCRDVELKDVVVQGDFPIMLSA